ncbi:hypothetical protein SAMN02910456_01168 [Ruminococcaceae bacterium YRB3002]|nr:hypothetical protein SAMN02910456_01168 [Ruminococcaceae bacterium YRB3002]
MIDDQNIKDLPFDAEGGAGLYGHKPRAMHVAPPRYMTTRAAVFLALAVIGLNMGLMTGHDFYIPLACASGVLLFWSVTLRFIRTRWIAPVTTVLLVILCSAGGYFLGLTDLVPSMGIFSLGIACLSSLGKDDVEEDVRPAPVKEILIPYLFAVLAALTGYGTGVLFEGKYLFISNIISVTFLILVSILISKTSGSRYFFTSRRLTEFWDIPVTEFSLFRTFIFAKIAVLITAVWIFAIEIVLQIFVPAEYAPVILTPASLAAVLPFVYLVPKIVRKRHSKFGTVFFMYEAFIAATVVSLFFMNYPLSSLSVAVVIYAFVLLVGTDIIGSALLAVISRRQIFVSRSKYIDGTPFLMTMFSLLIMLVECCLYNAL